MEIKTVTKRDGRIVPFDEEKIATAIYKAAQSVGGNDYNEAKRIASKVVRFIDNENPNIEQIQDTVEKVLIEEGHAKVATICLSLLAEYLRRDFSRTSRLSTHRLIFSIMTLTITIQKLLTWDVEPV